MNIEYRVTKAIKNKATEQVETIENDTLFSSQEKIMTNSKYAHSYSITNNEIYIKQVKEALCL